MTDHKTRLAQREGYALKERLRAGDLTLDEVRLLAFLGVVEARGIDDPLESLGDWLLCDKKTLPQWLDALQRLAAKLPPKRVEVECPSCKGNVIIDYDGLRCLCRTGKVHHDTPAEQWLMVAAALAAARACLPIWESSGKAYGDRVANPQDPQRALRPRQALDACEAWVEEPTPERWETWGEEWAETGTGTREGPQWIPVPGYPPRMALLAAAKILGEPETREIVAKELAGRLL